ncbi:glycoside hydrolase 3 protein [Dipsacomyces acuminosporus]|nr:glycoside hydrolase 3 protein [Dipsacomyces acuminosporus]
MKSVFSLALFASSVLGASHFNGLNYNPKRQDGSCPNVYQVQEDLKVLRPYTNKLRIYSVNDCHQGEPVLRAMENTDWKVELGLWVNKNDQVYEADKAELLRLAKYFDFSKQVEAVIVGSEAVYRGEQTAEQLAAKVRDTKAALASLGLGHIPVSSSETWPSYHKPLIDAVDFINMHGFPYWEGVSIDKATDKMFQHIHDLQAVSNGKRVVVGESGHPSAGGNYGDAVASLENAQRYMQEFICRANKEKIDYYWFSAFDQKWASSNNASAVEKHWGIFLDDYRTPKFQEPMYSCNAPLTPSSASSVATSSAPAPTPSSSGSPTPTSAAASSAAASSAAASSAASSGSPDATYTDAPASSADAPASSASGPASSNGPAPTPLPKCKH